MEIARLASANNLNLLGTMNAGELLFLRLVVPAKLPAIRPQQMVNLQYEWFYYYVSRDQQSIRD